MAAAKAELGLFYYVMSSRIFMSSRTYVQNIHSSIANTRGHGQLFFISNIGMKSWGHRELVGIASLTLSYPRYSHGVALESNICWEHDYNAISMGLDIFKIGVYNRHRRLDLEGVKR